MNQPTLKVIVTEITPILLKQKFGRVFQFSALKFAVDFRLADNQFLYINLESSAPQFYIIKRNWKDLEKQAINPTAFAMQLRKYLANAVLEKLDLIENERIARLEFRQIDELAGEKFYSLIVQLTGRSSNLFILDAKDFIIDSLRNNEGDGQTIATVYQPPIREKSAEISARNFSVFPQNNFSSLSESLDDFYSKKEREKAFREKANRAKSAVEQKIAKSRKLLKKIFADLQNHGDAEKWKKFGDLILANLKDAARIGNTVLLVDYFDENAPTIEIEIDENLSLTEAAENFFKRYTKARNAAVELKKRMEAIEKDLFEFTTKKDLIEKAIEESDEELLDEFAGVDLPKSTRKLQAKTDEISKKVRRYLSPDGWEILVGKTSKDNDFLTFKIAKSLDFWLHAADYAGSHVVVKNPNRALEMPSKTLFEAARLAAFFSQGKTHPKAAVNYTQKKFVNKPKGAAAGLVSLSAFKTVIVEPKDTPDI